MFFVSSIDDDGIKILNKFKNVMKTMFLQERKTKFNFLNGYIILKSHVLIVIIIRFNKEIKSKKCGLMLLLK